MFSYLKKGNRNFKNLYTNTKSKRYKKIKNRKTKSSQLQNNNVRVTRRIKKRQKQ